MTRIFDEVEDWFHRREHHPHYHATNDTPEAPMGLALITSIENELHNIGHEVSDELHGILQRHLTVGNVLAHAGQWAQTAESSPLVQAAERYALGPAGEQLVATWVEDVAGLLKAQGGNMQAGAPVAEQPAEPAPAQ